MTKYIVYKIIEADGFTDEGKLLIHQNVKDGFGAVHEDYTIGVIKANLEENV